MLEFQIARSGSENAIVAIGDAAEDPFFPLDSGDGWAVGTWPELYRAMFDVDLGAVHQHPSIERAFWLLGGRVASETTYAQPAARVRTFDRGGFFVFHDEEHRARLIFRTGPGPRRKQVPFFILGAQRSGTTMLRLMINRHPHLAVPHETAFMTVFYPKLSSYGDLANHQNARRLLDDISEYHLVVRGGHVTDKDAILSHSITSYSELINAIMTEYAKSKGKERWGDKTPYYTVDIATRVWGRSID